MSIYLSLKKSSIIKSIKSSIGKLCYIIRNTPFYNVKILSAWVNLKHGVCANENFGDDLNLYLLTSLTNNKILLLRYLPFNNRLQNITCIGSILHCNLTKNSIVWGTGAISEEYLIMEKPKKVLAVRGPLTRAFLLKSGIECPEVYGDPAILLPLVYKPRVEKKYKYGIIPHYMDYDLPHVKDFRLGNDDVLFIKFKGYRDWHEVVDQINSCEYIISSSLHGMIVADAYGIPNVQVVFSDLITGGDFKYRDYMGGVGRRYTPPIDWTNKIDINQIVTALASYVPVEYPYHRLLDCCPFDIKKNIKY